MTLIVLIILCAVTIIEISLHFGHEFIDFYDDAFRVEYAILISTCIIMQACMVLCYTVRTFMDYLAFYTVQRESVPTTCYALSGLLFLPIFGCQIRHINNDLHRPHLLANRIRYAMLWIALICMALMMGSSLFGFVWACTTAESGCTGLRSNPKRNIYQWTLTASSMSLGVSILFLCILLLYMLQCICGCQCVPLPHLRVHPNNVYSNNVYSNNVYPNNVQPDNDNSRANSRVDEESKSREDVFSRRLDPDSTVATIETVVVISTV